MKLRLKRFVSSADQQAGGEDWHWWSGLGLFSTDHFKGLSFLKVSVDVWKNSGLTLNDVWEDLWFLHLSQSCVRKSLTSLLLVSVITGQRNEIKPNVDPLTERRWAELIRWSDPDALQSSRTFFHSFTLLFPFMMHYQN